MANELEKLRAEIDRIDGRLVALLAERLSAAGRVAAYKRANTLPVRDAGREKALLERVAAMAGDDAPAVTEIYQAILAASRARQEELLAAPRLRCGLLGEKLGHSFSPAIHAMLGDYEYRLIELRPEELEPFLRRREFDGLNVTIPYKKTVLPLCDELTEAARRVGSVNTIVKRPDGSLLGHNTDCDGFVWLLRKAGVDLAGKKVLVLGSGGASAAVQAALRESGAGEVAVVSREGENNYVNLYARHADAAVLVNATPVGMYPHTGVSPVELDGLPALEAVFDVIYNPARTRLLLDAESRGLVTANGLGMLVAQAAAASERFTGRAAAEGTVERILAAVGRDTLNLLLIGMPGCGKSTVGAALAEKLGRRFVDLDAQIAARAGLSIPEIFAREGEEGFRRREHEVLYDFGKGSGLVIAAGGGVVTRPENIGGLRQNSRVIWLRRDLEKLPTDGRPLSLAHPPEALWRVREPLYRAAADWEIDNNGAVEETVRAILEAMEA